MVMRKCLSHYRRLIDLSVRTSNCFNRNLEEINFMTGESSSKGVLAKAIKGDYLYKTGTFTKPKFSVVEPVIECICCDILELMRIKHASYELVNVIVKPNDLWRKQEIVCCRSKLFTNSTSRFISGKVYTKNKKNYENIVESLGKKFRVDVNNMIVFDYLVNNTDRHHNNFGFLVNESKNEIEFAPLFDHGFSLCADFDDSYLKGENLNDIILDCDYSKLCCGCNYEQLELIDSCSCNLDFSYEDLCNIVDRYSNFLPDYKVIVIKELLKVRLNKLKEVLKWKGII